MAKNLFELFNEKSLNGECVASKPHTLETLSSTREEQDFFIEKIADLENVELKVDYSDFSNFVFYNSALEYFNITGEKILNEYPIDNSLNYRHKFLKDLDGYQNYVYSCWPKNVGHLRFNTSISSSFIKVEDAGLDSGVYRTGLLNPNTGSLSIEMWFNPHQILTGSNDVIILSQKSSGSNSITLFLSGSEVIFQVVSGSTTNNVSTSFSSNENQYVAAIMDRNLYTGSLYLITGSQNEFPIVAASSSMTVFNYVNLGDSPLYICSGTLSGKTTRYFTGSLDEVRIWKEARSINDLSSSFNVKQHSQKNLMLLYRFNESGSSVVEEENRIVLDYSGRKLNGRVQNYYSALRASGSLLLQEEPDPLLSLNYPEVSYYIYQQQLTGSSYDRQNANKIIDLLPEEFLKSEEEQANDILKNFLYVVARHFDGIKLHIDQFLNILKVNYGSYDQAPDQLLDVVASFFGWEFTGNFLNSDAFQYFLGKDILGNLESNKELDVKLFEIKNEFWKRTIINLMHLYKTKGTKESVNSLLRIYGVDENFLKIKEYSKFENVSIKTNRILKEKSVPSLGFGTGSLSSSVYVNFSPNTFSNNNDISIETRVKFPLTSSANIQSTNLSGSIWSLISGSSYSTLQFVKNSLGSNTGTLIFSSSDVVNSFSLSNVPIFDNRWHNISLVSNSTSSSLGIVVKSIEDGSIISSFSASSNFVQSGAFYNSDWRKFIIGATGSMHGQYWMQEARAWKKQLKEEELNDHALNFQSYGISDPIYDVDDLVVHWRLNEDISASLGGTISPYIIDVSTKNNNGTAENFIVGINPYKRFLNQYSYIAPVDFGWNEDKIRIYNSSKINNSDFVEDTKMISLEFNMVDSLNEDIEQICKSLDFMNNSLGSPVNKYRVEYEDLEILRFNYFKRLQGKLNFNIFADMLDFFDRSFIDMIKKMIPARANFIGDEFVVESHIFERPKISYEKRQNYQAMFEPMGTINVWNRFAKNKDGSGYNYPLFLSGSS